MMYSDFKVWQEESNRIVENLNHATPQKAMEGILCWQVNEICNNINQLKNESNMAKTAATITTAGYDFGRDEKIFTAEQAARATIDSYKVKWFQYIWNYIDYKHAEHYVLKEIEKRANKGLDWIEFSRLTWPFNKFPELAERLQFLGFQKILSSGICVHCFSWKEEEIAILKY